MNKYKIKTISDYLQITKTLIEKWGQQDLWYRGVSNSDFKLTPSFYRATFEINIQEELQIIAQFINRAKGFVPDYQRLTIVDWYILMQHYGFPTRLLDWTTGSLIALFFSVRKDELETNRSVFIIDPYEFNKVLHSKYDVFTLSIGDCEENELIKSYLTSTYLPQNPIAINPPSFDKRIIAQRSAFTIHGTIKTSLEEFAEINKIKIARIEIDESHVLELKMELNSAGISESTIFPDLEGLSRELIFDNVIM